jgi:ribonuclease R
MPKKKRNTFNDPNAAREAKKYAEPIASRLCIKNYLKKNKTPQKQSQIADAFNIKTEGQAEGLRRRLIAMLRDGELIKNKKNQYLDLEKAPLTRGTVQTGRHGVGILLNAKKEKIAFIPTQQMRKAFDGDDVLVFIDPTRTLKGSKSCNIVNVFKRLKHPRLGLVKRNSGGEYYTILMGTHDQHHVLIPTIAKTTLKEGDYVWFTLTHYPEHHSKAKGKIKSIIGHESDPDMPQTLSLLIHNLDPTWPQPIQSLIEAEKKQPQTTLTRQEDQIDLSNIPFVTIDDATAKDFDDAVWVEKTKKGYTVYVAIADVSHFVTAGSPLDQEAYARSTSLYFPKSVVPMLPDFLSSGVCSLRPDVNRYVLVAMMTLNKHAECIEHTFKRALIRSHARLTYVQTQDMLDKKKATPLHLAQPLSDMYDIYKKLKKGQANRGAMSFNLKERKIVLDEKGQVTSIDATHRLETQEMIEMLMLLANTEAAKFMQAHGVATLYRVHPAPTQERIAQLNDDLAFLGVQIDTKKKIAAKQYNAILNALEEQAHLEYAQKACLKSMAQAFYHPDNTGHFGLEFSDYTHFTSPIRRYPDLLLHRQMTALLKKKQQPHQSGIKELKNIGMHCSSQERIADKAMAFSNYYLICQYMKRFWNKTLVGSITKINHHGFFVRLQTISVEGFVPIETINGYFFFEKSTHRLKSKKNKKMYCIGDICHVKVARIDEQLMLVDFALTD